MSSVRIIVGDCRVVMATLDPDSIDAVVTDPPYELGFMGKAWDASGVAYQRETWAAAMRVLKPGGHLLAFGGTRTYHRMACAIEDAGFEIRDCIMWLYGTGFPKSKNIGNGWGTALKPACEPIVVARKPLSERNVAANVLRWGTGGVNVDGCRVGRSESDRTEYGVSGDEAPPASVAYGKTQRVAYVPAPAGRWPANVVLDEEAAARLDAQSGETKSTGGVNAGGLGKNVYGHFSGERCGASAGGYGDTGGASRFFYIPKADREERDVGCHELPARSAGEATDRQDGSAGLNSPRAGAGRTGGARNIHPTVKPVELMRWLVRLVTPKGGVVLDPFMGSGSTGIACIREGFAFIGIEQSAEYAEIARARIVGDAPLLNAGRVTTEAA